MKVNWLSTLATLFKRQQQSQDGAMFRVRIVLQQAEARYVYSWRLLAARKRVGREERQEIDHKVALYVRSLNEVPPETFGTKTVEAWL